MKKIFFFLLLTCMLLVSGCTESGNSDNSRVVQIGDNVSVNYTGMLENGTVFDTSIADVAQMNGIYNSAREYKPLSFVAGYGQMIEGFDNAVIGMKVGENKTVTIPPDEAYGEVRDDRFIAYKVEDFEAANMTPVVGETIYVQGYPGLIVDINETNVTVDFNSRLAGKTLVFDIELVSINNPEAA
ncbi:peptidylprolyl isomerase [Methanolobus sediminis]|uniref:Peptidyl-prolyl cis-trans isomerase n=1 Tax=Methanolobus sediminis TaxID=3072978 RepID=A0AA51YIL5_9EURY|nr:peptidylprolyl isomerase [Methanolobus sediminis]WMW24656.1 peptidylprolyl isomerase [Methanolobus sediminis]